MNATIKHNKAQSRTTLYDLPLEMLDVIIQKSYLHWILNSTTKQLDEEVFRSLLSVDVCINRRITSQRFKKAIWRYLNDFYGKTKKKSAIIRNNRNYLLANIQPNDELITYMLYINCITEEQSHFIQRQHSTRDKNIELLKIVRSFDGKTFSMFLKCLRRTNQKAVARVIENGGGVIKLKVQIHLVNCTTPTETQLLHEKIADLQNKMNPRSHKTFKLIAQLKEEGVEILNSELNKKTLVVWVWCRSQAALKYIQKLYESNHLRDWLFEDIQPPIYKVINIAKKQFKKTVVGSLIRPISINFTQRIKKQKDNYYLFGVTNLRNEFYVLCRSFSPAPNVIRVYRDRTPFHRTKEIKIKEIKYPSDIGSNEKENCLYVSEDIEKCVWKMTRETDDQPKIIKWLTTGYELRTLSVSGDGQLLMINDLLNSLMIYGSDAELIRSIPVPKYIIFPRHAVETSIGNFIIIHAEETKEMVKEVLKHTELSESRKRQGGSNGKRSDVRLIVSELTRDGQMVIRRFIPSNEPRQLTLFSYYLSLDSEDRVYVADTDKDRVIILDSDLKWSGNLWSAKEANQERRIRQPIRLCNDKEMKHLIVGGFDANEVNVYTFGRN